MLQGLIKPHECPAFGRECTPRNPLGATMVSSEGACAAYYLYRRLEPRWRPVMPEAPTRAIDLDGLGRALPRCATRPPIVMGHGGGGAMSAELIEHLFLPAFGAAADAELGDSAVVAAGGVRLAFSTDSFVVRPLFFPGGSIGDLAVNGTVNDLAMRGAHAAVLSTAFILEEGTALADIGRVAERPRCGRRVAAGVRLVTGDTKVVDAGHGDGVFINTAGIGLVPDGRRHPPGRARAPATS